MPTIVRQLGKQEYTPTWQKMQSFTDSRTSETPDEIWLIEHPPVFTQGQAGKAEHILAAGDIPVVQVDRGGQVTYHGPGQQMMYTLIDVRRSKLGVRDLVSALENSIVNLVKDYGLVAYAKKDAPGVYVDDKKLCSVGLRIRKGCSFHGLALNVNMDLSPFQRINPCGYAGMEMVNSAVLGGPESLQEAGPKLVDHFCKLLGINDKELREKFDE
ncbi:lipoyl(octanoyl) transferase LipB [Glaciecola sp. MH2013]|uniref:lipoyl(octanoyl) transferase LipB n=1 Tax=Glaciecola sp. MH2013 TaxID=2785524 RepID=UPI00189F6A75|nr:lipoyl(octanoyl) transferase LipB [Glaciecola sp. MH2013]MBF7072620.1 lipoyl(octanoyl) transferase LipB [Glaciecola sp. MH2013]